MTSSSLLTVDIHSKSFGPGRDVIKDLQLSMHVGERVALVGPSGAGKSTLLNLIAGLDGGFDGEVCVDGVAPTQPQRPSISMLFQDPRLMPWLTALENLALVAEQEHVTEAMAALLDSVGLKGFHQHYPAQLSGGMKKRVALARAFVPQPRLLLMDEPFASLDAPLAKELRQLVVSLCEEKATTLLCVTHDLQEAFVIADRIVFLSADPMSILLDVTVEEWLRTAGASRETGAVSLLERFPLLLQGRLGDT